MSAAGILDHSPALLAGLAALAVFGFVARELAS
jgi:hypothetical protein